MSGEFHSAPADFKPGEPDTRYALIGAGFGLLLIFLGRRIPFRILGWPMVGVGVLFVVVMTGYALAILLKNVSGHLRPFVDRVRGHSRPDPQLGILTRDVKAHCWVAVVHAGEGRVEVVVDGDLEPDSTQLARARDLVADFGAIERRVSHYLVREAEAAAAEGSEDTSEIRALRIATIVLRSSNRPGRAVIDFSGPGEMRYWYCDYDYTTGQPSDLRFDT